ncbi:MAG: [FeFe] hydrogenase, group A [Dethiobacter sp.]|jgi:NADH-quinone oxidoreductase subunit G|nr:[FeFe] hydrogenase, group A [Dethiobacter sp.]
MDKDTSATTAGIAASNTLIIDGRIATIEPERNLLEIIRSAGINMPTFCYHSDLSAYGACRLCIVEIQGSGIVTSCTTTPEPGMVVYTNTANLRKIRRITVELLLASHDVSCPTCAKSASCRLLDLTVRLGVGSVRYRSRGHKLPLDRSSLSLVRDPNKCVLCGDCVRVCQEVQGIGVLDFAYRGSKIQVLPAFGQGLGEVECVNCGQCSIICPTGALTVKNDVERVWQALHDTSKLVAVQVAPAVRVGIGEAFNLTAGETYIGQITAALRHMGASYVYDTAFAADLTVLEEGTEFLKCFRSGERLPRFTSCCPAWVKLVEQRYPDMLGNLSSCKSPQQMFGRLIKRELAQVSGRSADDIFILSIMPCTAKKFEAARAEFSNGGRPDVDAVITTLEFAQMIREAGLNFASLEPDRLDMPFGFKSGAGVLFGTSGGVSEAVLRFVGEIIARRSLNPVEFHQVRGLDDTREALLDLGDVKLSVAVVYGLAAAQSLVDHVRAGRKHYDLIEVMACPGGCIGGAGQPYMRDNMAHAARQQGIYKIDTMLQMHKSQENPYLQQLYTNVLQEPGSDIAHELLHTQYRPRRRTGAYEADSNMGEGKGEGTAVCIEVCVGTNCHLKGSHDLLHRLIDHIDGSSFGYLVDIYPTFCHEMCDKGPTVRLNDHILERCTFEMIVGRLDCELERLATKVTNKAGTTDDKR